MWINYWLCVLKYKSVWCVQLFVSFIGWGLHGFHNVPLLSLCVVPANVNVCSKCMESISYMVNTRWASLGLKWSHDQLGPDSVNMLSSRYRKSHCGDKTVVRSSYLHNGISYTGKISSLYWIRPLDSTQCGDSTSLLLLQGEMQAWWLL